MGLRGIIAEVTRIVRGSVTVSDVRANSGGDVNATGELYQPAGEDAQPLQGDIALMHRAEGTSGEYDCVGFVDTRNAPQSNSGEKRMYARNATTGAIVATVWLKNDGTVVVENSSGSMELKPSGEFTINTSGKITSAGDYEVFNPVGPPPGWVSLVSHTHPVSGAATGPPTPVP